MASIEDTLPYILKNEGLFIDNPIDPGGATMKGITLRMLSSYLGRPATVQELKNMTDQTVTAIYKKYFYDPLRIAELPLVQGICLMDMGVNRGCESAIKNAQWALGIHQDGVMGDQTIQALSVADPRAFVLQFVTCLKESYIKIVEAKPNQISFLSGWMNRLLKMFTLVNS